MYCLRCGQEILYSPLECPSCGKDLRYLSHGPGDHVSQVLQAVEALAREEISLSEAESVYLQFSDLATNFLQYWRLDSHPQLSQRARGLTPGQLASLEKLEVSLGDLERALDGYSKGFAQECMQTLMAANLELESFFRASCAGIAGLRGQLFG